MEEFDVRYAWRATVILASIALMVMYTEGMLMPSLPTIQDEFGITAAEASWILSIYTITGTVAAAVFGKLGDIYGKKRVLTVVIFIYAVAVTFTGYAPTFPLLLVARAIQGVGMAMFPLAFSLIREEFPPRMVPVAQGLLSAMFGIGIIISLPLGAWISQTYGWRVTYHTATPIALLVAFSVLLFIRESRFRAPSSVNWISTALFAAFAVSLIIALTEAPTWGWGDPKTLSLFALSFASLTSFILNEASSKEPFLPRSVMNLNVTAANAVLSIVSLAMFMSFNSLIYIYEMPPPSGYGLSILQTGIYAVPPAVVQMIMAPLAGRIMVRAGIKPVAFAGLAVAVLGNFLIAFNVNRGLAALIASTAVAFAGIALLNTSLISLITFSVPRERLGLATGLNTVLRNLAGSIGPAVAGTLITTYTSAVLYATPLGYTFISLPSAVAYRLSFYIAAAAFIAAFVPLAMAKEVIKRGEVIYTANAQDK
ncbi:MAG: MFS transporter [Thermoproteus sp. AZ2]|jgi:MFS family permease|uniref:MFS transporter n=1 Tax=Thermoproteus sp. AZ2 TaxID=1609232 RepID=A0ACC6UY96_9CREN